MQWEQINISKKKRLRSTKTAQSDLNIVLIQVKSLEILVTAFPAVDMTCKNHYVFIC